MLDDILDIITSGLIAVSGVGAIGFTLSYGIFFNWRKNAAGRALMWVFISLGALVVNNALGVWLGPEYPGRSFVRAVLIGLVTFTIWRLLWTLWRNYGRSTQPLDIQSKRQEKEEA